MAPDVTVTEKECTKCKEVKQADAFYRNARMRSGLLSACKDCTTAGSRAYHAIHGESSESRRDKNYRRKYGIDFAQKAALLAQQDGACLICGTTAPPPSIGDGWVIDHDHSCCPGDRTCGACIRGILCRSCNSGIGFLNDDPALLAKAIAYLTLGNGSTPR